MGTQQQGTQKVSVGPAKQASEVKVDYDYTSKVCVIGTSDKGPAFVPVTVSDLDSFIKRLSTNSSGSWEGLMAARSWFGSSAVGYDNRLSYVRVLGIGNGEKRNLDGTVTNSGFTVGEKLPEKFGVTPNWSPITHNPYSEPGGPPGRTYFLGTFMSQSVSGQTCSLDGIQVDNNSIPMLRGVLMAPSGVVLTLKNSFLNNDGLVSSNALHPSGASLGELNLVKDGQPTSQFVMLLNGHKGTVEYPNVITASFNNKISSSDEIFYKKLNTDPTKIQEAGHYLYSYWETPGFEESVGNFYSTSTDNPAIVFLLTGSCSYNSGSSSVPNYECFTDRFSHARTPWVISQKFDGKNRDLFRLHLRDDGSGVSSRYSFIIRNLKKNVNDPYGTFDLLIKPWNSDAVENFTELSLDPYSVDFIAKRIGDVREYFDFDRESKYQNFNVEGEYPNLSEIVRVEIHPDLKNGLIDPSAFPVGFRGISHLVTSGSSLSHPTYGTYEPIISSLKHVKEPPLPLVKGVSRAGEPWGVFFSSDSEKTLNGFVRYYPNFRTDTLNFSVGDNSGAVDTLENGILDADRFNNNMFSLENISVYVDNNDTVDKNKWSEAQYIRDNSSPQPGMRKVKIPDDINNDSARYMSFSFLSQGGFDGVNIFDPEESKMTPVATECDMKHVDRGLTQGASVAPYTKALQLLEKTDEVDFELFTIPGMKNEYVTNSAIGLVEGTFDSLYLMDIWGYDAESNPVTGSTQVLDVTTTAQLYKNRMINSSFVATYFPDTSMKIENVNSGISSSATTAVLASYALNDRIGQKWFAPVGTTRGVMKDVVEIKHLDQLSDQHRLDELYDANINPFKMEAGSCVVWGQKTNLLSESALERVNVRRLLIDIRRTVRKVIEDGFMFSQNTLNNLGTLQSRLDEEVGRYQRLSGIDDYKILIDTTQTNQSDIENNTVRGKIVLRARRTEEVIAQDMAIFKSKPRHGQ